MRVICADHAGRKNTKVVVGFESSATTPVGTYTILYSTQHTCAHNEASKTKRAARPGPSFVKARAAEATSYSRFSQTGPRSFSFRHSDLDAAQLVVSKIPTLTRPKEGAPCRQLYAYSYTNSRNTRRRCHRTHIQIFDFPSSSSPRLDFESNFKIKTK